MLHVTDRQIVSMPADAKLLDVQVQAGAICLWALCDEVAPPVSRNIAIYGTGNPIPSDPGEYIATFQLSGGDLVFHVFEMKV